MPEAESYVAHTDYYRYGFVLESKTQDIFGEYEFKGILAPDSLNNIDGTYLKKDGKIIVNGQRMDPMPVITGACKYPEKFTQIIQQDFKDDDINQYILNKMT